MIPSVRQLHDWLLNQAWAIRHEAQRTIRPGVSIPVRWTLLSCREPLGLRAQIDFDVRELWDSPYSDIPYVVFSLRIGFPDGLYVPSEPMVRLEHNEVWDSGFRQVNRVLVWFRDPTSWSLWEETQNGDWFPPEMWKPENYRPGTETERFWSHCEDGTTLYDCVRHTLSERKQRLLACALFRALPLTMLHEKNRLAVHLAELYAEGRCTRRELKKCAKHSDLPGLFHLEPQAQVDKALDMLRQQHMSVAEEEAARVIREVVASPFETFRIRSTWFRQNGGTAQRLAEAIDLEQDFASLPILADALEDVDCDDFRLLEHCRSATIHSRGCWVLDLLRGKA